MRFELGEQYNLFNSNITKLIDENLNNQLGLGLRSEAFNLENDEEFIEAFNSIVIEYLDMMYYHKLYEEVWLNMDLTMLTFRPEIYVRLHPEKCEDNVPDANFYQEQSELLRNLITSIKEFEENLYLSLEYLFKVLAKDNNKFLCHRILKVNNNKLSRKFGKLFNTACCNYIDKHYKNYKPCNIKNVEKLINEVKLLYVETLK